MRAGTSSLFAAMKWSLLADWAGKVMPPLVFLILAGLLTPADFGVMSAAAMVIGFSQIFWDAGLGKALIRWPDDVPKAANVAFRINVALGLFVASILFAAAGPLARSFFQDDRVTTVLRVMTLEILLGSLAAVHRALLQREMKFRQLFWIQLLTVALPAFASIPLAWAGMGYWALVAGALVSQLTQVTFLWSLSPWRPSWSFDPGTAKGMLRFGRWVGLTGLVAWVYAWSDTLIVGHYFGTSMMGLYRVGNQAALIPFAFLFAFASPVLYSRFSAHAHDFGLVRGDVMKINGVVGALSLPLALAVIVFSPLIEVLLFSEKWRGVGIIIAMVAAKEGVLWIFAYNIEAYRALARPQLETAIAVLSAALNPLILILCAQQGFGVFLFGRAVLLGLVGLVIHSAFSFAVFGRASVARVYTKLLLIFAACALLFGVHRLLADALAAMGGVVWAVNALVVAAAFLFAFAIQKESITELARAVLQRNRPPHIVSG